MEIDLTTLKDLEITRAADGSAGILGLLDFTKTTLGRTALRRRLEAPPHDTASVHAVQAAVRFFRDHGDIFRFEEAAVLPVERYLASNIQFGPATPLGQVAETAWMSLRYRDLLREIRDGLQRTDALFRSLESALRKLESLEAPPLVQDIAAELRTIARAVLDDARPHLRLALDRHIRDELAPDIRRALYLIGELDALTSMGCAAGALGWPFPEILEADGFILEAEGLFHPFVDDPITNPLRLSGGEPMVFLTGPNMAGKTTYLKSVAILVLLAQAGLPVPASAARLTPVEHVFTSLNPSDNLKAGLSYFLSEVMRVKAAATILAEGGRALVLFDEVFKGTNVKDALEASREVITGFAKARQSGFIFSSHLSELAETLEDHPTIRFCYFDGEIVQGTPRYSYRIRDGVSNQRFGLLLLREARVPELIARIRA